MCDQIPCWGRMDWLPLMAQPCFLPEATFPPPPEGNLQFQTTFPVSAMTRVSLSPSTLFPGLHMLFQAHSLRCRFCGLPEISDLNGEDYVFQISFWEFSSGLRMIWGNLRLESMLGIYSSFSLLTGGEKVNTVYYYYCFIIIKGHYIITKGSVFQEDIAMLNVHAPNNRASKSIKQKRIKLKGEIGKFTVMFGEVNTRVSVMGRTKRQKVSMDIIITESLVCARLNAKHLHFLIWSAQYLWIRYYYHPQFTDVKTEA